MSTPRFLAAFLLALLLQTGSLLAPAGSSARELGPETAATSSDLGAARSLAQSEPASLEVTRQAYDLLLDRYVQPLNPADLLVAAYEGLVKRLKDAGTAVARSGPLKLEADREKAWTTFASEAFLLQQESGPSPEINVNAVLVTAMARWVDEGHTAYLTPEQYQAFLAYLRGDQRYVGIGIRPRRPGVTVAEVFPDSPAEAAGMLAGDQIIAVDGEPTDGKSLEQVAQLIRGPEGAPVQLDVERPRTSERLVFIIVRALIKIEYLGTEIVQENIAYIRLRGFPEPSVAERLDQFVDKLQPSTSKGLVIDLRGNAGGRLDVGLRVLNRFIASGPLYDQVDRTGRHRVQMASGPGWDKPIPIAVLIDDGTASMGEIFAAAMRENGKARLIGKKTAGNVAAAQVYPLGDGSAVQVTILEIFSGNGERLNRAGVVPDHELDISPQDLELGRDSPLEAAVQFLWEQSARAAASR
jgi:carboxyl-terminal processing protease